LLGILKVRGVACDLRRAVAILISSVTTGPPDERWPPRPRGSICFTQHLFYTRDRGCKSLRPVDALLASVEQAFPVYGHPGSRSEVVVTLTPFSGISADRAWLCP